MKQNELDDDYFGFIATNYDACLSHKICNNPESIIINSPKILSVFGIVIKAFGTIVTIKNQTPKLLGS